MNKKFSDYFDGSRLRASTIKPGDRKKLMDARSEFDSDFGRVIFSAAARRLHDKTQVIPLTSDDNVHSRLTHSMEVMNIGCSLAKDICNNDEFKKYFKEDQFDELYEEMRSVLQTVCLIHDIGNPPFGHFGETAICEYFKKYFEKHKEALGNDKYESWNIDFTEYDGNAQGFRIITKLQFINDLFGLNLTKTSLAAYIKYPNLDKKNKSGDISHHKHGVFKADQDYFESIMDKNLLKNGFYHRHPLAFLMEASDSICYLAMDIEDAFNKNWISTNQIQSGWDSFKLKEGKTLQVDKKINDMFIFTKIETLGKQSIVSFRIKIISYLVSLATKNFVKNIEGILKGTYQSELIFDDSNHIAEFLNHLCGKYIYSRREIQAVELTGWSVISGLLDIYINLIDNSNKEIQKRGENMISKSILRANKLDYLIHSNNVIWDKVNNTYLDNNQNKIDNISDYCDKQDLNTLTPYYRFRIIVDFISGMTDKFAVRHYQQLSGQRI